MRGDGQQWGGGATAQGGLGNSVGSKLGVSLTIRCSNVATGGLMGREGRGDNSGVGVNNAVGGRQY